MSDKLNDIVITAVKSHEQGQALMEKLLAVAQPGAVYGTPVIAGEYTVITASEVSVSMGFGYGIGTGGSAKPAAGEAPGEDESQEPGEEAVGYGGGGGGGGVSMGRPVAVITIGPQGVHVEPVVDPTKIALAFFSTVISMFLMLGRMRRAARG